MFILNALNNSTIATGDIIKSVTNSMSFSGSCVTSNIFCKNGTFKTIIINSIDISVAPINVLFVNSPTLNIDFLLNYSGVAG